MADPVGDWARVLIEVACKPDDRPKCKPLDLLALDLVEDRSVIRGAGNPDASCVWSICIDIGRLKTIGERSMIMVWVDQMDTALSCICCDLEAEWALCVGEIA